MLELIDSLKKYVIKKLMTSNVILSRILKIRAAEKDAVLLQNRKIRKFNSSLVS